MDEGKERRKEWRKAGKEGRKERKELRKEGRKGKKEGRKCFIVLRLFSTIELFLVPASAPQLV